MIEVEVRCCCDAHLIGYMQVPRPLRDGQTYIFPLSRRSTDKGPWESLTFQAGAITSFAVETGCDPVHRAYLALKSNDYPIEKLRRIREFREATAAEAARSSRFEVTT